MVERRRLQGKEDIRAAVKKLLNKYKVGQVLAGSTSVTTVSTSS